MCGINGILGIRGIPDPRRAIQDMNDALAHRGPDAKGIYVNEEIALGHQRLSIIDLSPYSDQPMSDPSGRYHLVFNGELYNYQLIRGRLKEWDFRTNGDTEVVLAAYVTWGSACLQWFNGMFAFAVWDDQQHELFLCRDRLGIKPLYYSWKDEKLVFSSEIRALLASGVVPGRLNRQVIPEYLRYQTVYSPRTLLEDVQLLPSGYYMKVSDSGMDIRPYWRKQDTLPLPKDQTKESIQTHIRDLLNKAVERRLVSDVPFGAFLSGGIDSSAVVGLMAAMSDVQVSTFNVSFDESEFSEAAYARGVAERFHTAHHEILLRPQDFLEQLPAALAAMDHPSGDGPNTYVVSKVTKEQGITMALSGLGGDELFAGYPHFLHVHSIMQKKWLVQFPRFLRQGFGAMYSSIKGDVTSWKASRLIGAHRIDLANIYPIARTVMLPHWSNKVWHYRSEEVDSISAHLEESEKDMPSVPLLSKISIAELEFYLQHTLLRDTDQMSMAHALEVRVPFLDHELVEYVLRISDEQKYPHSPKKLLVDSLEGLLPEEVTQRKKMGFTLPWEYWMKSELRTFCEQRFESLGAREGFDSAGIQEVWKGFLSDHPQLQWSRIWHLVVLEDWLARHGIEA